MSELAPRSGRSAWDRGADEATPARHSQRGALAAERAAAPASAVVLRPNGRLSGADSAGLEPGSVVVDDGSRGHVGRRCCAPTDSRGHRQLGRGPLTTRVTRSHLPGADPGDSAGASEFRRPATCAAASGSSAIRSPPRCPIPPPLRGVRSLRTSGGPVKRGCGRTCSVC